MPPLPQAIDLLVVPRWLLPIEPAGAILEDHALAIDAGRIVDVLPADFARQGYQPRETLELPRHAVIPGLVNAHTHAAMCLMRGLSDDLALMDWLQKHIWPAEARHVGRQFCLDGVRLAVAEMIRGGTTCFNDMYFFPDATVDVVAAAGLRATVGMIVLDFPTAWGKDWQDYVRRGLAVFESTRHLPLVKTAFAPHAPYSVSDAPLRRLRELAHELAVPIHMHVHETAGEVSDAVASNGKRPWQRLLELDVPGDDFIAVHMTQLNDQEILEVARLGVSVVHCPESNLKLASGFAPVARLLNAGVNVAIGTDGAASNNDLDLFGEMRTAALLGKGVAGDPTALPAATVLHMATMGGARALGLESQIGSLVKGKSADFIAIDLDEPATQPVYNLPSQLVYAAGRHQVSHSFVAGRALMRDKVLLTVDERAATVAANTWRDRIRP